jgi:hypothetical protein
MPTNILGSDSFTANVQVPNTGENADQSAWSIGAQPLTNRTEYLRNRLPGAAVSYEFEVPLLQPLSYPGGGGFPTEWTHYADGPGYGLGMYRQASVTAAYGISFRVPMLPRFACNITAMRARIAGGSASGGHSDLPVTKPRLILDSAPLNTGAGSFPALTVHAVAQNSYASVAAYDAAHDVTTLVSGSLPIAYDPTRAYFVRFTGETGSFSASNRVVLQGIYLTLQGV